MYSKFYTLYLENKITHESPPKLFVLRMEPETQEEEGEVTLTGEVIGETEAEAASSHLLQTMPDASQTTFMVYPLPSCFQPLAPLIN